jgi:hypothetical protein
VDGMDGIDVGPEGHMDCAFLQDILLQEVDFIKF